MTTSLESRPAVRAQCCWNVADRRRFCRDLSQGGLERSPAGGDLKPMAAGSRLGILIAILAAGPAIALVFELRARGSSAAAMARRTAPAEPCWTEDLESDGATVYARAECVNEALMEMDARAALRRLRQIPRHYGG